MQVSLRERYLDVVLVERVVYRLLHLTGLAELVVDKHPISHEEIHRVVAEVVEHHAYRARQVYHVSVRGRFRRQGMHAGYTAASKKAIVTLTKDSKEIEFFNSMV